MTSVWRTEKRKKAFSRPDSSVIKVPTLNAADRSYPDRSWVLPKGRCPVPERVVGVPPPRPPPAVLSCPSAVSCHLSCHSAQLGLALKLPSGREFEAPLSAAQAAVTAAIDGAAEL